MISFRKEKHQVSGIISYVLGVIAFWHILRSEGASGSITDNMLMNLIVALQLSFFTLLYVWYLHCVGCFKSSIVRFCKLFTFEVSWVWESLDSLVVCVSVM